MQQSYIPYSIANAAIIPIDHRQISLPQSNYYSQHQTIQPNLNNLTIPSHVYGVNPYHITNPPSPQNKFSIGANYNPSVNYSGYPSNNININQNQGKGSLVVNTSKWNIQNHNGSTNLDNFPFGKDRVKISNYVAQKLSVQNDEQNRQVIQKFRMQAIKNRNQRVMKHLGKIPYISESMMPGSSIDTSKFIERQRQSTEKYIKPISSLDVSKLRQNNYYHPILPVNNSLNNSLVYLVDPKYVVVPMQNELDRSKKKPKQKIILPRKDPNLQTTSVAVSVNFQDQFPIKKKKKSNKDKRKYYTIQQQQQVQAIYKIEDMLHSINKKLKKNSKMLQQSLLDNISLTKSRALTQSKEQIQQRFNYQRREYFTQPINQKSLPSVIYTKNPEQKANLVRNIKQFRSKTRTEQNKSLKQRANSKQYTQQQDNYSKQYIKDHLSLLKSSRKRMDQLDQFVYKY